MDGRMDDLEWMDGGWICGWMNGQIKEWKDGWTLSSETSKRKARNSCRESQGSQNIQFCAFWLYNPVMDINWSGFLEKTIVTGVTFFEFYRKPSFPEGHESACIWMTFLILWFLLDERMDGWMGGQVDGWFIHKTNFQTQQRICLDFWILFTMLTDWQRGMEEDNNRQARHIHTFTELYLLILGLKFVGSLLNVMSSNSRNLFIPVRSDWGLQTSRLSAAVPVNQIVSLFTCLLPFWLMVFLQRQQLDQPDMSPWWNHVPQQMLSFWHEV